jgi:hypothetical protein
MPETDYEFFNLDDNIDGSCTVEWYENVLDWQITRIWVRDTASDQMVEFHPQSSEFDHVEMLLCRDRWDDIFDEISEATKE